jgi:hypothetical protein
MPDGRATLGHHSTEVTMRPADPPTSLDALLTHRRRTRARLLRVQRAIGVYEELACAAAMPPELRPPLPRRPTLSRAALCALERTLLDVLVEIDAAVASWHAERRN